MKTLRLRESSHKRRVERKRRRTAYGTARVCISRIQIYSLFNKPLCVLRPDLVHIHQLKIPQILGARPGLNKIELDRQLSCREFVRP